MHMFRCSSKKTKHLFKILFLTSLVFNQDLLPASPGYHPLSSVWNEHFMSKEVYKVSQLWLLCYTTISRSHGFGDGCFVLWSCHRTKQWSHLGGKLISLPTVQEAIISLNYVLLLNFSKSS